MPWFSQKRAWPEYLSFHLYSGKSHRCILILFPSGEKKLPETYAAFYQGEPPRLSELSIDHWAFSELNVPSVSDDRVLLQWCKSLIDKGEFTNRDGFIHHDAPRNSKKGKLTHKPAALREMIELPLLPGKAEDLEK